MEEEAVAEPMGRFGLSRSKAEKDVRPLTTDERASFVILSLYMATFCVITFVYWDSLVLKILGITVAAGGLFLFVAAFFNTEAPEKSTSMHPLRSYMFSLFYVLSTLFLLRFAGGLIRNSVISVSVLYIGILLALVVFRKAMVQVISTLVALGFLFVTFHNLNDVLAKRMGLHSAFRQCGEAIFQIGPIQEVANILLAGPYLTYLNRIDYRDAQINMMATRIVARSNDDALLKTKALLDFVSNEIHYVSDPDDGLEYAKEPVMTIIAGAGDCEDQALLLCSLLESVGVNTYMAFTDDHVFVLVRFPQKYAEVTAKPHCFVEGRPCYALDAADPGAQIGTSVARPEDIKRVFDVRDLSLVRFTLTPEE